MVNKASAILMILLCTNLPVAAANRWEDPPDRVPGEKDVPLIQAFVGIIVAAFFGLLIHLVLEKYCSFSGVIGFIGGLVIAGFLVTNYPGVTLIIAVIIVWLLFRG
ncbi:MAG: hypothetical protein IIV92_00190 [Schwartzia sp.]|nr:hypothetical protein [Schwartzia sp. (in: firmicutes)]